MAGNADHPYDLAIVGGGPSGLAAARAAASRRLRTLVVEELPRPGSLAHPCGGAISPVPGFVSASRRREGLRFPELGLTIPYSLVIGQPTTQRYLSPGGHEFRAEFSERDDFPVSVVDVPGLLCLLADQAVASGAELRFGTRATGLLLDGETVVGVRTSGGDVRARLVVAAEGVSRRLCRAAELPDETVLATARGVGIAGEELEAPAVTTEDLGQITTFGRRFTAAQRAFGTVILPAPGRAIVQFSVFSESTEPVSEELLWARLSEYKSSDPRVRSLFVGARAISRSACRTTIGEAPARLARDGFLGLGDAITPGGRLGIIPSLYLGGEAGRVAAEALRDGEATAERLAPFDRLFRGPILRGVETEAQIVLALVSMSDVEIDRVCRAFAGYDLSTFLLYGRRWPMLWETLRWVLDDAGLDVRDRRLLRRAFEGGPGAGGEWGEPESGLAALKRR